MFKLCVFAMLVCAASAGLISSGIGIGGVGGGLGGGIGGLSDGGLGHGVGVAVAQSGVSYQNNNQLSLHPTPLVASTIGIGSGLGGIGNGNLGGVGLGIGGVGLGGYH